MKIHSKTLLVVSVTAMALLAMLHVSSNFVFLKGFEDLEDSNVRENVQRALGALTDEYYELGKIASDYSMWDDTYAFIMDANDDYIRSNMVDDTFIHLKINFILYVNASGQIVYSKGFDLQEMREMPVSEGLISHISTSDALLVSTIMGGDTTGLILLPEGPIIVASEPITTSSGEGPVRGAVVFARYMDSTVVDDLAQMVRLSLNVQTFDGSQMPDDFEEARSALSGDDPLFVRQLSASSIAGYTLLRDIYGDPCLLLRVDLPRSIYAQGQAIVSNYMWLLAGASLVYSFLVIILLKGAVLSRLERLSASVVRIGSANDLSGRVAVEGGDELSSLAQEINKMLAAQEGSQSELKRYAQNLEEMVAKKTRELLEAEQMVTAGRVAAMVGHDLRNPLQTIRSATSILKRTPEKKDEMLDMIERATEQAANMLEELRQRTREPSPQIKETNLADLIKKSVAETSIPASISVEVRVGNGLESVQLDPDKVRRVLENLFRNAVEAMPDGGNMEVSAERKEDRVSLRVSDNGVGIPEEVMRNLFKPFHTTKSKGMGLGLAYCKRTIEAHRGAIDVESVVGKGTTITMTLPIDAMFRDGDAPSRTNDVIKTGSI